MHTYQDIEQILRTIAADDLAGFGAYVVSYGDVASALPNMYRDGSLGWTSHVLDVVLKPWLIEQGRWIGRGFACVVNDHLIPTRREKIGVVGHEFAHWLSDGYGESQRTEPDEPTRLQFSDLLIDWVASPENKSKPWDGHERRFCRAAAHVAYRLELEVMAVKPCHLKFSRAYTGYSEGTWMSCLDEELKNSTGSIIAILDTEPSATFNRAWDAITCD